MDYKPRCTIAVMRFKIDSKIFDAFPGLGIGVIIAKGVNNSGIDDGVQAMLSEQVKRIRTAHNLEALPQEPKIDTWRKAYTKFGGKPKENRSSVENLHRLILRGTDLRHINKLVDAYNLISLKHMVPVGGEDIDKMQGDIILTFAGQNEVPVLLLGDKEPRPPHAGEVIYKDGVSTICRRWNWREADRTKLTEGTKNCILVIEGLPPVTKNEIETATSELSDLIKKSCGGTVTNDVLDQSRSEIEF